MKTPQSVTSGFLEVGTNERFEVVVNIPPGDQIPEGYHVVFSPSQARMLAQKLMSQATIADKAFNGIPE